ncbi:MAG: hypothetical protein LBC80_01590 [Treponema sp.]|jgi:hypothetical protein|nr:hypothetical protein [Treponema sp.]
MIYEKCRNILLKEFELIQNAVIVQDKIRTAISDKEWAVFETHLGTLNSIESNLESLEKEREKLFGVCETLNHEKSFSQNLDEKGVFYTLVALLPDNERNDLTTIYQSLKFEALKLRIANEALLTHVGEIKSTLNDFFAMAFPQRCSKIYNKEGIQSANDMSSMVLNRSF